MKPLRLIRSARSTDETRAWPTPAGTSDRGGAPECAHCGLALGPSWKEEDGPFCCAGCRAVYSLIHSSGLDRYYDIKQCATSPPGPSRRDNYTWLDSLLEAASVWPGTTTRVLHLDLQGVHCAACVWLIERLFEKHPGGSAIRINPALGSVELRWDPEVEDLLDFLQEVEGFGYRFGPPHKGDRHRSRALLVRLGVAAAAAMNVMIFSISYYAGLDAQGDPRVYELFGRLSLALATISVGVGGWPFIQSAWRGLRRGIAHLDLPIALGILLTYGGSIWAYAAGGADAAYFDTLTIFVALMLFGRWLQESVVERNRNLLLASAGVADLYTRRFAAGRLNVVSASELREDDELWIAPGDLVPARGILLHTNASLSMDWITGEADPVEVGPGELVAAGAFNAGDRGFRLHLTESFSASRLNELLREESAGGPEDRPALGAAERWWQRVATVYVSAVLGLGALALILWGHAGWHRALEVCVAVLVVSCPCALGLGLPLSREMAHARLRRAGVLLRNDSFLDRALQLNHVVFDKTGTLTRGQLRLEDGSRRALLSLDSQTRTILSAMCSRSKHPVARCVSAALSLELHTERELEQLEDEFAVDAVHEQRGLGLELQLHDHLYRLGRGSWAASGDDVDDSSATTYFSTDGRVGLRLSLEEDLKPDAPMEVQAMRELGLAIHILSGDRQEKVERVALALDIDTSHAHAGVSPEDKARVLRELDRDDTLMVGDGLNDTLGFDAAFCSATPAVDRSFLAQKSDFYFLGDGIAAVRRAVQMARHLRRVQTETLVFAAIYNLAAVALCLCGWVSPVVAAILMPLSSVIIVLWTSRRLSGGGVAWMS